MTDWADIDADQTELVNAAKSNKFLVRPRCLSVSKTAKKTRYTKALIV
jgi:hypothetical protein